MKARIIFLTMLGLTTMMFGLAQHSYRDSITSFVHDYIQSHEVVTGADKELMKFFPVDENFRVTAHFEKPAESNWFLMETSGREKKMYRVYGKLTFRIHDTLQTLNIYQSQSLLSNPRYKDYLAIMFTDATSGEETYENGRYIDYTTDDIKDDQLVIDFNKAYNPYCAYVAGKYNCPVPPPGNNLSVAIKAGERAFSKKVEGH